MPFLFFMLRYTKGMSALEPILYSFRRCPYAMRARFALAASGQSVQLREIVLRNKPDCMLSISPKGTVPVLLLSDQSVLEESLDIMYWALKSSDPKGLLHLSVDQHAIMLSLIAQNDGMFKRALDRYKYPSRYIEEHEGLTEKQFSELNRDQGAHFLLLLEKQLTQSPFLLGTNQTMADIAIAPFVRQYANTHKEWFDQQAWPELHRWLADFLNSTEFEIVMHKYVEWSESAQIVYFPLA